MVILFYIMLIMVNVYCIYAFGKNNHAIIANFLTIGFLVYLLLDNLKVIG